MHGLHEYFYHTFGDNEKLYNIWIYECMFPHYLIITMNIDLNYCYHTLLLCICMYTHYLTNLINIYIIAVCVNDAYICFTILHNYSIVMYGRYMNAYY